MSDWLPKVIKIDKLEKHPHADALDIVNVMGVYPCIVRRGQYKEGDLVSWIPYDSVVPDIETFAFLAPKNTISYTVGNIPEKYRTIKAKKIRGMYSEGLIVDCPSSLKEGDCIIDYFGLTKRVYPEELPDKIDAGTEKAPSSFSLFKYDLAGLAQYGYAFEEEEPVVITEKIEGENCAMVYMEDRLWVRSRNYFKRYSEDSQWWEVPNRMGLEDKLKQIPGLVIWGELYGAVKGWHYDCSRINNKIQREFRVFDIWDIFRKVFLNWDEVQKISNEIGLKTVPVLYRGPWKKDGSLNLLAEGKSTIGACVKEGWVMRSDPEGWHHRLGRKIIKLKGKDYKLAKG